MNLTTTLPIYLALALALLLTALFEIYRRFGRRLLPSFYPLGFWLKTLALILVCLALARPFLEQAFDRNSALLLLDISKSMDQGTAERLINRAKAINAQGIEVSVVPFAAESSSNGEQVSSIGTLSELQRAYTKLNYSATSLPNAFSALSGFAPSNVLLITDGYSNKGDLGRSLTELSFGRFRIFPLTDTQALASSQFLGINNLHAPLIAPTGKSVEIRLSLRNSTSSSQSGQLEIFHDTKKLASRKVSLGARKDDLTVLESDPALDGIREIRATFVPDDKSYPSSTESIFLSSRERDKVLLINGAAEDARFLEQALKTQAFKLESLDATAGLERLPDFENFSAVILNNVSRKQLPSGTPILMQKYVKNGGGFVMLGAARSFGLGGYKDTEIEETLPIKLAPPQTTQKRLNVAVELVLDKSRSMADGEKLEFAKEAAREVVRTLKDDDLVGVVGFDSAPFEVVKLAPLTSSREQVLERVGRLFPSGKTNLLPAMDEARRRLEAAPAGRKHMIILTDGQLPDGGPYYVELVKQMRLVGITVSTVLLGSESDFGLLQAMGDAGGGAFYQTADPRSLPRIFISDIKVSSGERTMKEQQEYLVRAGPSGVLSTSIRNFPPVRGYVQSSIKEGANLELVAFAADRAEPLLASWKYGKGRAVAYTTDANGRWSNYWVEWPRFQPFWSEVIESLNQDGAASKEDVKFDLRYFVEDGNLVLDLSLYTPQSASKVGADLELPSNKTVHPAFSELSRGHFRAVVENPEAGKYTFRGSAGGKKLTPVAFKLPEELFGEKSWQGFNLEVLSKVAANSGGKFNPSLQDLKGTSVRSSERVQLENWILLLALLLLLIEIIKREIFPSVRLFKRFSI